MKYTLKPQDVRIGNYVIDSGDGNLYQIPSGLSINSIHLCNPVELTEEWLVKFGFTKDKYSRDTWVNEKFCIYKSDENIYWRQIYTHGYNGELDWIVVEDNAEIKFVHQLQNYYYTVNGEELQKC